MKLLISYKCETVDFNNKEVTDRCHVISCRTSRLFQISLRRPININVYTLFSFDKRWTIRQTISSGKNIVSYITCLHQFNFCRISQLIEYFECKLILQVCAAILYVMISVLRTLASPFVYVCITSQIQLLSGTVAQPR